MMRILACQDDLRYGIIKSKAVSLICICSCYFLAWSCCGPIRFILCFGFGLVQAQQFSGRLYKKAGRLGFREAKNYVELLVQVITVPLGLACVTVSRTFV